MKTLLIVLAVSLVLVVIARLVMPRFGSSVAGGVMTRDGGDALADCPGSPNCAGSMASDAARRIDALPGAGSVPASLDALESVLASEAGAQVVTRDGAYLHATFTTKLMRYTDDVEFLVDGTGERIEVRSASRLGRSDLGANAARVERLGRRLRAVLPAA